MGDVGKYLQKLGMDIYDNETQPGVPKNNDLKTVYSCFSIHQLEVWLM